MLDAPSRRGRDRLLHRAARTSIDWPRRSPRPGTRPSPYHAGLPDDERARNQDEFIDERVDVVVATVAFGMGIDRSDVRFVVHAGAPKSLEHYQQEAGRAGRDGLEAECVLLYSAADFLKWRRIMELQRRAHRGATRAPAGDGAVRRRYRLPAPRARRAFRPAIRSRPCGACDWCLRELEPVGRPARPGAEDRLVRGARQGALRSRARERRARGQADAAGDRAGSRHASARSACSPARATEIRGYVEQLIAQEFLVRTAGDYPIVQLTAKGIDMLRGQVADGVVLCRQPRPTPRSRGSQDGNLADRARIVGGRRSRAVRGAPPHAARAGARARRAAVCGVPRQHAARARAASVRRRSRSCSTFRASGPPRHRASAAFFSMPLRTTVAPRNVCKPPCCECSLADE